MKTFRLSAMVALGVFGASAHAAFVPLPVFGNVALSSTALAEAGTLLADTGAVGFANGNLAGTLQAQVWRNAGGTLDFYYRVTNSGFNYINRITNTDFDGFTASVTWLSSDTRTGYVAGTDVGAVSADRDTADVVGFRYAGSGLPGGSDGAWLVIRTNAVDYAAGTTAIIDGRTAQLTTYGPIGSPVPEPATMALAGLALTTVVRRRLRRTA